MRLIDADGLKKLIAEHVYLVRDSINSTDYGMFWTGGIERAIDEMPTVEERKVGKWVRVPGYCTPGGDPLWACSECGKGEHVFGIEYRSYGARIAGDQWVACPNCGATMEGEER